MYDPDQQAPRREGSTVMSWFRRMVDRIRNYFSSDDQPGSGGTGGGGFSSRDRARAEIEALRWRDGFP
jgi:hypothetical protein